MATSQVNGSQSTNTSARNNGGAVINAGNSESCSSLSSSNSIKYVGTIDNNYVDPILSGGVFNFNNILPIGSKTTIILAGKILNFTLQHMSKDPNIISIHYINGIRSDLEASALRQNKYNRYLGKFDFNYPLNSYDPFGYDLSYQKKFTINIGNPKPETI